MLIFSTGPQRPPFQVLTPFSPFLLDTLRVHVQASSLFFSVLATNPSCPGNTFLSLCCWLPIILCTYRDSWGISVPISWIYGLSCVYGYSKPGRVRCVHLRGCDHVVLWSLGVPRPQPPPSKRKGDSGVFGAYWACPTPQQQPHAVTVIPSPFPQSTIIPAPVSNQFLDWRVAVDRVGIYFDKKKEKRKKNQPASLCITFPVREFPAQRSHWTARDGLHCFPKVSFPQSGTPSFTNPSPTFCSG